MLKKKAKLIQLNSAQPDDEESTITQINTAEIKMTLLESLERINSEHGTGAIFETQNNYKRQLKDVGHETSCLLLVNCICGFLN